MGGGFGHFQAAHQKAPQIQERKQPAPTRSEHHEHQPGLGRNQGEHHEHHPGFGPAGALEPKHFIFDRNGYIPGSHPTPHLNLPLMCHGPGFCPVLGDGTVAVWLTDVILENVAFNNLTN